MEVDLLQTCFVIEKFGCNWTGTAIGNAWRLLVCKVWGILLWTDFLFKMLLKFKASMPLLANFIFRNRRFFVSIDSQTLTALNSLLEEMSKIIPSGRCSGDPTSVKCEVKIQTPKTRQVRETSINIMYMYKSQLGQDKVSGGVSVRCWHTAPVENVLWKHFGTKEKRSKSEIRSVW